MNASHTLDLDKIGQIAHKGVMRAAAFLGIGVNAARDPEFKKYQLSDLTMFRVIPDSISDAEREHIKEEFEKWIIVNGLRELVESFALYLDRIHTACLLMATSKSVISTEDANTFGVAFERKGLAQKLTSLKNGFNVTSEKGGYLASINRARNCITHRNGRVGPEDVSEDNILHLKWWALDIYIETPNGERHDMMPPYPKEGIFLKDGGTAMMKVTDRALQYQLGQYVHISPKELSEICLLFRLSTGEVMKSVIKYAESLGIEIQKIKSNIDQEASADS